jgi:hypothetical protein
MKRAFMFLMIGIVCLGVSWAAYMSISPTEPQLSKYVPPGALLYLQAKDFSSLLTDWNRSPQKQRWLESGNYQAFSHSRLFLRLNEASAQFATAAGLPSDMNFVTQVAGDESALALYDIGKLEFVYITRLPSANFMQTALWQTHSKFETREAGGVTFYLRRDPESEREVEFAVSGDYVVLATREDLMAEALNLMAGSKDRTIESEQWWAQSTASAGPPGDLRMVLNLEKLVPSPYFRSYWIQRNITDMKQYNAAVSDLFRSGKEYREERVLLKKSGAIGDASAIDGSRSVADLARLVPADAGAYEIEANPSVDSCFNSLETKILAPHFGPAPSSQMAPGVQLTSGETGGSADLETRIDQAPAAPVIASESSALLKNLIAKNQVRAILRVQSTDRDKDGVFVRIHSAVALAGASDWSESEAHAALVEFIRPGLTTSQYGVGWQQKSGYQELDGLWTLTAAVRGKYMLVSDDPGLVNSMLRNMNHKADLKPATFVSGFNHAHERENFAHFTSLLDRPGAQSEGGENAEHEPQFFSENMVSLSSTLADVSSETIVIREVGDKVIETVTYQWSQ